MLKSHSMHHSEELAELLCANLSDMYALFLKTQNYHWNIKGTNCLPVHEFLGKWYDQQLEMIDLIAERISSLGHHVPANFDYFSQHQKISDPLEKATEQEMLTDLLGGQEDLVNRALRISLTLTQKKNDDVTADILIECMRAYEKNNWFIRNML